MSSLKETVGPKEDLYYRVRTVQALAWQHIYQGLKWDDLSIPSAWSMCLAVWQIPGAYLGQLWEGEGEGPLGVRKFFHIKKEGPKLITVRGMHLQTDRIGGRLSWGYQQEALRVSPSASQLEALKQAFWQYEEGAVLVPKNTALLRLKQPRPVQSR